MDKRLGAERKVIGKRTDRAATPKLDIRGGKLIADDRPQIDLSDITAPSTPQAKALDGSYGGFQPKPAVEIIIVAMKPLSEKTFVDQALKNNKGITWLDDGRIPYESEGDKSITQNKMSRQDSHSQFYDHSLMGNNVLDRVKQMDYSGRFPANLLVSDDVLNDGKVSKGSGGNKIEGTEAFYKGSGIGGKHCEPIPDSGSFSRYFDLDKWWAKTFPFLIVPKASKSEKNKGLDILKTNNTRVNAPRSSEEEKFTTHLRNNHPTVKPLKLMSYLITLGSHPGDIVLDPFGGSGTTALASKLLGRYCIGIEIEEKYCEIAAKRCSQSVMELKI